MVRDADASWRKTRKQLRDDSRWELCVLIDAEQKEKLFLEHIENLSNKRKRSFRKLLDECEHVNNFCNCVLCIFMRDSCSLMNLSWLLNDVLLVIQIYA